MTGPAQTPPPQAPPPQAGHTALSDALQISFRALRFVMLGLLIAYVFSGVFVVPQHERAFVLVWGKPLGRGAERLYGPGLHWTFPRPIAEIVTVPTERVQAIESDAFWYFVSAADRARGTDPEPGARLDPARDGYTLSGDANILHSRWIVRYTIADPERYVFHYTDAPRLLEQELQRAVVRASAAESVDGALRTRIEAFRDAVDLTLRQRVRRLELGLEVQRVDLVAVTPPRQTAAAFDAVIEAEQERSRAISAARAQAARTANEALGAAARLRSEAEAYRIRIVAEMRAAADYFLAVREKYLARPRITVLTLWQETLRRALPRTEGKYILRNDPDIGQELRLLLAPERPRPQARPGAAE